MTNPIPYEGVELVLISLSDSVYSRQYKYPPVYSQFVRFSLDSYVDNFKLRYNATMTITQLHQIAEEARDSLGFIVDEDDIVLWAAMRATTPKRLRHALQMVAADPACATAIEKYTRLMDILHDTELLVRR